MESEPTPDDADVIVHGKRKRSTEEVVDHLPSSAQNEDHTDERPDGHSQEQTPPPEGKKPRLDLSRKERSEYGSELHAPDVSAIVPAEIWQHVFSFVDPLSLECLMSVCLAFKTLLNPSATLPAPHPGVKHLMLQSQDDVWSTSRKRFMTNSPRPMHGMSEFASWKLVHGVSCQFCGKKPSQKTPILASTPWNSGPGPEGVRAIWPFQVRSCGSCIAARLVKEADVLLSSSSVLLPALPFALFTPSLNYVTSTILRQTQPPPNLQLTKYFFRPQLDDLSRELTDARELGEAAMSEWYKGLEIRGRDNALDAARFEQWELQNTPPTHLRPTGTSQQSDSTSPNPSLASTANFSYKLNLQSPHWPASSQGTPNYPTSNFASPLYIGPAPAMPFPAYNPAPGQSQTFEQQPAPGRFPIHGSGGQSISKVQPPYQRNRPEDIAQRKADRRAEIERRCQELEPPLMPSTLEHMDAFNVAIQISMPLNDNAWEVLKSRLLAQRPEAERRERDSKTSHQGSTTSTVERQQAEKPQADSQSETDRIWTEIQKPLREKIKAFADQIISTNWANGMAVNKGSSGKFAADILQHVKGRYYDLIAKEDKLLVAQSMTIPPDSNLHEDRRLKLEDMKWIYEEVIKPHTERFGKDIFLCSICEATTKKFSFDAVIQHYAAKHTSSLSRGNAVVYWKADWPLEPPFHPAPDTLWQREYTSGFAGSQYAPSPAWTPFTSASLTSPMPPGQPNGIYNLQCEEMVSLARHAWEITAGYPELHDSIRLYVIIHQIALGFALKRFMNKPTLSMFTDCLLHKPALRPLKDLNGLRCKICHTNIPPGFTVASNEFDVVDLLSHFQRLHVEIDATSPLSSYTRPGSIPGIDPPRYDWEVDMIQLPHESVIQKLGSVREMPTTKLEMLTAAFPNLLPALPPRYELPGARQLQDAGPSFQPTQMPPPHEPYRHRPYSYLRPPSPPTHYRDVYDPHTTGPPYVQGYRNYERNTLNEPPPQNITYIERPNLHDGDARYRLDPARYPPDDTQSQPRIGHGDRFPYDAYAGRGLDGHNSPYQPISDDRLRGSSPDPIPPENARSPATYDPPFRSMSPAQRVQSIAAVESDNGITAAENFLNNFDTYVDEARGSDHAASTRQHSSTVTPLRPQPSAERLLSHESGSHRPSPRVGSSSRHLSRDGSPRPLFDGPGPSSLREGTTMQDVESLSSSRRSPPSRQPPIPHESGDPARQHEEYASEYYWRNDGSEQRLVESQDYPTSRGTYRSPPLPQHFHRRRAPTRPIRYIEILPDGRQRLVEELPSPTLERVEYVPSSPPERRGDYRDGFPPANSRQAPEYRYHHSDTYHSESFYEQRR